MNSICNRGNYITNQTVYVTCLTRMRIKSKPNFHVDSIHYPKTLRLDVYKVYSKSPKNLLYSPPAEQHQPDSRPISPNNPIRKRRGRPSKPLQSPSPEISTSLSSIPQKVLNNPHNYTDISPEESHAIAHMKVSHAQYIKARTSLILARAELGFFRKREAHKLVKMDVNKIGKVYEWMVSVGWLVGE